MPLLTGNVIEEEIDEKYDLTKLTQQYIEEEQMKSEESPEYYPEPETAAPIREEFPGCYNFQFSLANQDSSKHWVVSILFN